MSNDASQPLSGLLSRLNRRQLFRLSGIFGAGGLVSSRVVATAPAPAATPAPGGVAAAAAPDAAASVFKSIGVRPMINCRGTLTVIGGSVELPEVRAAKMAANPRATSTTQPVAPWAPTSSPTSATRPARCPPRRFPPSPGSTTSR